MKTLPAFISIPAVGGVPAFSLDPLNRAQVASLIRRAEAYFKLSAQDWEARNDSSISKTARDTLERAEQRHAANGEMLLAPLGIKCDWPGLYPSFLVGGFWEYGTREAVLSALGHPRSFIMPEKQTA